MSILGGVPMIEYLCDRITGNGGDRGISSDALISAAVLGRVPAQMDRPRDVADLSRCFDAFVRAPRELRLRMLPILGQWIAYVEEQEQQRRGAA